MSKTITINTTNVDSTVTSVTYTIVNTERDSSDLLTMYTDGDVHIVIEQDLLDSLNSPDHSEI